MAGTRGRRLVLVPIGMSRAGIALVHTAHEANERDATALARMLAGGGELPRRISELVSPETPTTLHFGGCSLLKAPWFRGSVLCVGAAAHASAPAFGQSDAQAVEDALVLGELVSAGTDRATLLDHYMQRRWQRARRVHEIVELASHWIEHPEPATNLMSLGRELHSIVAQPA